MWACLSLLITLCLLHGGGAKSHGSGPWCLPPPSWKIGDVEPMKCTMGRVTVVALLQASCLLCLVQASRMDGLRQKLENQGLKDVAYMVVNQKGEQAQRLHAMLAQRLSVNITLYNQRDQQPDVWQVLNGKKDDFLIYDRCGRITHKIPHPYSIIGQGNVEGAIKEAYCSRTCGQCEHESVETLEECAPKADTKLEADAPLAAEEDTGRGRHHQHHQHHHAHGHHVDGHGGVRHGQDHDGAGQQGVRHQGHERDGKVVHSKHNYELGQMQEAVSIQQIQQDAPLANV